MASDKDTIARLTKDLAEARADAKHWERTHAECFTQWLKWRHKHTRAIAEIEARDAADGNEPDGGVPHET